MKWIRTEEKLPAPDSYLVVRGYRSIHERESEMLSGYMYNLNGVYIFEEHHGCFFSFDRITHWMYLSDLLLALPDPTDKLRPCPRCGSCDIVLENNGFDEVYTGVRYTCHDRRHAWDEWFSDEEKARKAWNETP